MILNRILFCATHKYISLNLFQVVDTHRLRTLVHKVNNKPLESYSQRWKPYWWGLPSKAIHNNYKIDQTAKSSLSTYIPKFCTHLTLPLPKNISTQCTLCLPHHTSYM